MCRLKEKMRLYWTGHTLRSSVIWNVTRRRSVVSYRRFGTTCWFNLQGSLRPSLLRRLGPRRNVGRSANPRCVTSRMSEDLIYTGGGILKSCQYNFLGLVHTTVKTLIPQYWTVFSAGFNPLNPELNPICYLLALLGARHFLHVSRIRVKLLTLRRLMSYIYGALILDVSRSHTTTQHSR